MGVLKQCGFFYSFFFYLSFSFYRNSFGKLLLRVTFGLMKGGMGIWALDENRGKWSRERGSWSLVLSWPKKMEDCPLRGLAIFVEGFVGSLELDHKECSSWWWSWVVEAKGFHRLRMEGNLLWFFYVSPPFFFYLSSCCILWTDYMEMRGAWWWLLQWTGVWFAFVGIYGVVCRGIGRVARY